jgi:predicted PurR-regulated permease PerM
MALLLAYVLEPLVLFLSSLRIKNFRMPNGLCVLLIYLIIGCLFFLLGAFFLPQIYHEVVKLAKEITAYINSIDEDTINNLGIKLESFFRSYDLPLEIVNPQTDEQIAPHTPGLISIDLISLYKNTLRDILLYIKSEAKNIIFSMQFLISKIVNSLFKFFLILMITAFILIDTSRIKNYLFKLIPKEAHAKFNVFLHQLDKRLSGVVRGQLIICLINALLTLIGLLIFNIKFSLILATTAGILSLVPIFGSIISTIPIVLVALTESIEKAVFALIWIISIHFLEANFLNPKIMGDSAKIHPVLIILSLLIGEHYYGIVGALLAVPIISVLITAFNSVLSWAYYDREMVAKPIKPDKI